VPNIPSFSVDDGFWYSIPEHLTDLVVIGSIVRVPLSGRRVRGWVCELGQEREGPLKDIAGVSGAQPVFTPTLLKTLQWAAIHYVAPLSVLLAKATPPNLPKQTPNPKQKSSPGTEVAEVSCDHPLSEIVTSVARGARRPSQVIVGPWQKLEWITCLSDVVSAGRSAVVIAATAAEVNRIADTAVAQIGDVVVSVSGDDDASLTRSWERCQQPGRLIIGTPRVSTWQVAELGLIIVLEEARRAMKDRHTPTLHVRDVIRSRSLLEGITSVFFGPTPSVEVLASGAQTLSVGMRAWPLVEVIDRSEEAPGAGQFSEAVLAALRSTGERGEDSFVLASYGTVERITGEIDTRLSNGPGGVGTIAVGTERDLSGLSPVALAVATNPDGMLLGRSYRTSEETLRVLARLGNAVSPGPGHRMMVQTAHPHSDLIQTLRRGDPLPYLERVLVERAKAGVPPSTSMLALELRGDVPEGVADALIQMDTTTVLGPLEIENGVRWLLDGDLRQARRELRPLVSRWREAGTTVRVDADPIDL